MHFVSSRHVGTSAPRCWLRGALRVRGVGSRDVHRCTHVDEAQPALCGRPGKPLVTPTLFSNGAGCGARDVCDGGGITLRHTHALSARGACGPIDPDLADCNILVRPRGDSVLAPRFLSLPRVHSLFFPDFHT